MSRASFRRAAAERPHPTTPGSDGAGRRVAGAGLIAGLAASVLCLATFAASIDLRAADGDDPAAGSWAPVENPPAIDLADFIGGDWTGRTPTGAPFRQIASGPFRTIVKYDARAWERWKVDSANIRHWEDHNVDDRGAPVGAGVYRFTENGWFPRRTFVGHVVEYASNWLIRYGADGDVITRHPFPYRIRTVSLERNVISGQLRVQMEYDPGADRTKSARDTFERYWLYQGEGWREWAEHRASDRSIRSSEKWMASPGDDLRAPVSGFVPMTPPLPVVAIREVLPLRARAPVRTRGVFQIPSGAPMGFPGPDLMVDVVEWQWRRAGQIGWRTGAVNPAFDLDHTFTFEDAGAYEIALTAYGPGGMYRTVFDHTIVVD
jgi:hypothetical protein